MVALWSMRHSPAKLAAGSLVALVLSVLFARLAFLNRYEHYWKARGLWKSS